MVPAQQEEVLRVLDLVGQQEADGLDGLPSAVHVVAEEEVVGVGRVPGLVEVPEEVAELPVDVTDHVDRRLQFQQHRLSEEDLPGHQAQLADLVLGERGLRSAEISI